MACALILLFVLNAGPLDAAKQHLAAGKLDDVLFDLDGKSFPAAERPAVAAVLAEAAHAGLETKDLVLALQFSQMSLRLEKNQPLALEIGARASLLQKQFDPAEDYADRLMAQAPKAPAPRLLRAEIALEEGEWAKDAAAKVIVYSTAWCGYCTKAKAWLTARKIPFVAKDIEKQPEARAELNGKKRAVGKERQGGVPWIDTGSELLTGFDVAALERIFPRQ